MSYKRARRDSVAASDDMQLVPMYNDPTVRWPSRYGGRSRSYIPGRNSYKRTKYGTGPYAQLNSGAERHVSTRFPPPEIKTFDTQADGTVPTATPVRVSVPDIGAVIPINNISSGSSSSTRVGLQCVLKNCSYRFEVDLGATAVATSGRVMLIWDRQPNGVAPTYATIFTQPNYLSFGINTQLQRFVILRNQQFSLSPNGNQSLFFEGFTKLSMRSTFSGNTLAVTGALYVVYIADQTITAQQPVLSGFWRVRFVDV